MAAHTEIWNPKSIIMVKRKSSGAFSQVYIGKHEGIKYAIKVFTDFDTHRTYNPFDREDLPSCVSEENALLNMPPHPNVIRLVGKYIKNKAIHFAYELGKKSMHAYDPQEPLPYIKQLLAGLKHCHSHNIIHLDLKPDNVIMMDTEHVKIADFGHAVITPDVYASHSVQYDKTTLWYRSPEQLFRVCYSGYSDIWAMGCILYELYVGRYFCMTDTEMQMVMKLFKIYGTENIPLAYREAKVAPKKIPYYPKQDWLGDEKMLIPEEYQDIIRWMLHPDHDARPTIHQVCEVFDRPSPASPAAALPRSLSCPDLTAHTDAHTPHTIITGNIIDYITANFGADTLTEIETDDPEEAITFDIITDLRGVNKLELEPELGAPLENFPVEYPAQYPYPTFMFLQRPKITVDPEDDFLCTGVKVDTSAYIKLLQTCKIAPITHEN